MRPPPKSIRSPAPSLTQYSARTVSGCSRQSQERPKSSPTSSSAVAAKIKSPLETPLWSAIESFVAAEEPEAKVAPVCLAGFTDSHWLREAFGTIAYGFFPARAMPAEVIATLVHSADERVPVADLELGVDWLRFAARAILA